MTPLDVLRAASANCPACHGIIPDNLTPEGLANQLRGHGIDPLTLDRIDAACDAVQDDPTLAPAVNAALAAVLGPR